MHFRNIDNYFIKRTAERLMQLIVEVATDINGHILVESGDPPPKDYYESFILLSSSGIIEDSFAREIGPIYWIEKQACA